MSATTKPKKRRAACHRPAPRPRRFRHDSITCLDMFSGFGGMTNGAKLAGFDIILAANHNEYKIRVHERNHPEAEHWIADLVDPDAADYHSAEDLPPADMVMAGVACTSHSQANTLKAYEQGLSLFDLDDPDYDARVTKSERDRATSTCVLQYARKNHPRLILVECTTELVSWGPALPGKKIGDGSTYKWWLKQFELLGYRYRVLYLNSMFFGVPQSRDRLFIAMWDRSLPTPDLDHRPPAWCEPCGEVVPAVWTWKTGVPRSGAVRYGQQYRYTCPRCRRPVVPTATPSLAALDLSNLGPTIGERPLKTFKLKDGTTVRSPLAPPTMARAERCRQKFPEFPGVLMPAKAVHGSERHPWVPLNTQTSQQETAILSTGATMGAAGNTFERPGSMCRTRDFTEPLPAQTGTVGSGLIAPPIAAVAGAVFAAHRHNGDGQHLTRPMDTATGTHEKAMLVAVSSGVVPFRQNTLPTTHVEAMPTVTSDQIPGLLTAAGTIKNNGGVDQADYRAHPVSDPLGAITAEGGQSVLFGGWYKQNGSTGDETAPHPFLDPFGTLTARDTTGLLTANAAAAWKAALDEIELADCHFRMLGAHEVGRGCGFDVDFPGYQGTFEVWGSARDQVDGFGNAVSPAVGEWIGLRLRAILDRTAVLA